MTNETLRKICKINRAIALFLIVGCVFTGAYQAAANLAIVTVSLYFAGADL